MNLSYAEAHELAWNCDQIAFEFPDVEVGVFPPSIYVGEIARLELVDGAMFVGAQDCHDQRKGAFTGCVSPTQLLSAGVKWVLLGHSECRQQLGQSNEAIARKLQAATSTGLKAILCIGETELERTDGRLETVLAEQIAAIEALPNSERSEIDVAYEPVWAIGTGHVPTNQEIQDAHRFIRDQLVRIGCHTSRIVYGGSVSPENASQLAKIPGVDGFLVGGASLNSESFRSIVESISKAASNSQ